MSGKHVTDQLSDFLDGTLEGSTHTAVEEHLQHCATCLGVLRDLEAVVQAAARLGPIEPPTDLWSGIRDGIVRTGSPLRVEIGGAPVQTVAAHRRSVSVPQAAAAAVLVSLLSAGGAWWVASRVPEVVPASAPVATTPEGARAVLVSDVVPDELTEELRVLEAVLERSTADFDPNTWRILERNLSIIDRAIRESLEALATEPSDPFLEEHLKAQMRRKVRVLRNATGLSAAD